MFLTDTVYFLTFYTKHIMHQNKLAPLHIRKFVEEIYILTYISCTFLWSFVLGVSQMFVI